MGHESMARMRLSGKICPMWLTTLINDNPMFLLGLGFVVLAVGLYFRGLQKTAGDQSLMRWSNI